MNETPVEALVREKDEAARQYDRIDTVRREMRLGRHIGQTREGRFWLLKGVFGGGWFSAAKNEPLGMSPELEHEFYAFLTQRMDAAGKRCRDLDARLAAIDVTP